MAEPFYTPLSPIKSPQEGAASELPPLKPSESDSDLLAGTIPAGDRVSLPSKLCAPGRFQKGATPHRQPFWRAIKTPLEMALLPLAAIGYLAFCYTVHGKAVPVNTYGLYAVTPEHYTAIKGGVTSISIIIISIALLPVYAIISDLKSEEFFRVLASQSRGVPLETINHISNPSFGNIDMLLAMWSHACSNYYILGIVASLLVWIVATLAPGALTINSVLADGALMAFAVGAVPIQSVLNGTFSSEPAFNASLNAATAAAIAWAEMELDVQYSFGIANSLDPDYVAYIAPVPVNLPTTTSARWLSDVIGINPACSWPSTNLTTVQLPFNSSSIGSYIATAYLADFNLDIQVTSSDISGSATTPFATVMDPTVVVTNHTTNALPTDGSTVFLLGQCLSGCLPGSPVDLTLDLSSIDTTFTIAFTDETWSLAILTCLPNIVIETREVRNDGHGILSVQPRPNPPLTSQGNLNTIQTTALFSIVTSQLTQGPSPSGSRTEYSSLGSQVQGDILFGPQFDALPGTGAPPGTTATLTPAPIENVTQGYTQIIQSGAKSYLAGYLGTAYVPGRISVSEIVFAASIPNLAVATAVLVLLVAVIVLAHFRRGKGIEFTLVNVAAAVHSSELPGLFSRVGTGAGQGGSGVYGVHADVEADVECEPAEMASAPSNSALTGHAGKRPEGWQGDSDVVETLGDKRVFMRKRADGSPVLHIEC